MAVDADALDGHDLGNHPSADLDRALLCQGAQDLHHLGVGRVVWPKIAILVALPKALRAGLLFFVVGQAGPVPRRPLPFFLIPQFEHATTKLAGVQAPLFDVALEVGLLEVVVDHLLDRGRKLGLALLPVRHRPLSTGGGQPPARFPSVLDAVWHQHGHRALGGAKDERVLNYAGVRLGPRAGVRTVVAPLAACVERKQRLLVCDDLEPHVALLGGLVGLAPPGGRPVGDLCRYRRAGRKLWSGDGAAPVRRDGASFVSHQSQ